VAEPTGQSNFDRVRCSAEPARFSLQTLSGAAHGGSSRQPPHPPSVVSPCLVCRARALSLLTHDV
jgi:hypothetical protein